MVQGKVMKRKENAATLDFLYESTTSPLGCRFSRPAESADPFPPHPDEHADPKIAGRSPLQVFRWILPKFQSSCNHEKSRASSGALAWPVAHLFEVISSFKNQNRL